MARRRKSVPQQRDSLPPWPVTTRIEVGPDGYDYEVRPVAGAWAVKSYRCPGCDHEIRSGTPHVVVWRIGFGEAGIEDRRHWHSPCWASRATCGPSKKR